VIYKVNRWFQNHGRALPWRGNVTPWEVVMSEFMLQQTQVSRVIPYFEEFRTTFPTPSAMAKTPKSKVISMWGGLGYPRRALRLHELATVLAEDFDDEVPADYETLISLPGIGNYTANAILAFAFQKRSIVIDTNIRRVIARAVLGQEWPTKSITKSEREVIESLVPRQHKAASMYSAAIMELGQVICVSKPKCDLCPIKKECNWVLEGKPAGVKVNRTQAWHGTNRKCRGMILRAIREESSVTIHSLSKSWENREQLESCVEALIEEGFIKKSGRKLILA
jgi:A/G-specific adenine glycosylase